MYFSLKVFHKYSVTLSSGLIFSLKILYFQTFQITCRLAMRINNRDDVLLYALDYCLSHISTLAGRHLSTFSTFVHSRLFVNKHWLHINNRSHDLSPLFIFIFFRLPPRRHCPFINYRKCCPYKAHSTPWKKKCTRSRPLIMMTHQKTIQSSSYRTMKG